MLSRPNLRYSEKVGRTYQLADSRTCRGLRSLNCRVCHCLARETTGAQKNTALDCKDKTEKACLKAFCRPQKCSLVLRPGRGSPSRLPGQASRPELSKGKRKQGCKRVSFCLSISEKSATYGKLLKETCR